ncbi:hypothetical protein Deval_1730 [Nitratidesulfovibrio vulgaris RCH1]|nr:hypothetical protein Deval_1730 [Nitratidesulfovibrio vulgaris RCH1]
MPASHNDPLSQYGIPHCSSDSDGKSHTGISQYDARLRTALTAKDMCHTMGRQQCHKALPCGFPVVPVRISERPGDMTVFRHENEPVGPAENGFNETIRHGALCCHCKKHLAAASFP